MPPKPRQRRTAVIPRTHVVQPRSTSIQTSGIFKFPPELFLHVFSYLTDHRRFIRENYYGRELYVTIGAKDAERSVIIRKLTMTCWPLRNLLLPLLWTDVEGCISHSHSSYENRGGGLGFSVHAQCDYLALNPAIAAYVQTFSVDLNFSYPPENLITKFVDCLVRLPNLKTLEILSVSSRTPISTALKRKCARFPSIRELRITRACHHFIRNCPNLENLTFINHIDANSPATLRLHGMGLKRVAGIGVYDRRDVWACGRGCPNLQEIGIFGNTRSDSELVEELRQLWNLAVVNVDLEEEKYHEPHDAAEWEKRRRVWRRKLISLLKDSPSAERKFLRWRITQSHSRSDDAGWRRVYDVAENEELEVLPEASP